MKMPVGGVFDLTELTCAPASRDPAVAHVCTCAYRDVSNVIFFGSVLAINVLIRWY